MRLVWIVAAIGVFHTLVMSTRAFNDRGARATTPQVWQDLPSVRGTLRVTAFGGDSVGPAGAWHVSVYVNGRNGYDGMKDNDIRGFLDGAFKWGWNQPDQIHVRIGRRGRRLHTASTSCFGSSTVGPGSSCPRARSWIARV